MIASRLALEEIMQNRLQTTDICKDALRMQASASDLFNLYSSKHHADDTSSSSCYAEIMAGKTIKREAHTPTTDQSEDSGVDVSSAVACGMDDARGPYKRRRSDRGDGCPTAVKSSRTDAVLSVNVAMMAGAKDAATASQACSPPPFRPWSSDESASDVGLRMFHDIRNVDRILTLTRRRKEPSSEPQCRREPLPEPQCRSEPLPEPQPLDLTNSSRTRVDPAERTAAVVKRKAAVVATAERVAPRTSSADVVTAAERVASRTSSADAVTAAAAAATADQVATDAAANATTKYSKNMSRARRIEANARERSRVHTISAAFDTLRSTVPSYSKNQKLSKLSTIRIASAYILTLSRLLDMDYSAGQDSPSVEECVNNITGIIHMEGKVRKRKDEP